MTATCVYLLGFEVVRNERRVNVRKRGGVCSHLRTNLNYRTRDDLNKDYLECVIEIEISNKPRSSAFLVGSRYRPPNPPPELSNEFEKEIDKIDAGDKELYILSDVNCNLLPDSVCAQSPHI